MNIIKINNSRLPFYHLVLLGVFAVLLLARCEKQENFKYIPGNPGGKIGVTVWDFIQQNDSFSLMRNAVVAASMEDYYANSDSSTYIIPTNQAFRNYLASNGYSDISSIPVPILKNVLLYHIVKKEILTSDTALIKGGNAIPYQTGNGQEMYLSHDNNYQMVINSGTSKSWVIEVSNIEATNGVIQVSPAVVYFSAAIPDAKEENVELVADTAIAIQDTYVWGGGAHANTNYSNEDLLQIKNVSAEGYFYAKKVYLMYDLSDIKNTGSLRKAVLQLGVDFSHGRGIGMNLFNVPNTSWLASSLTWNNAPAGDPDPIASLPTSKKDIFEWDITKYISEKLKDNTGKISIEVNADPESDEVDNFYSTRNSNTPHPRIIVTFSSGNSTLAMGINKGLTVAKGGIAVLDEKMLEMTGAAHPDIIYTLETPPNGGWLINGSNILKAGSEFTQLDIDMHNILYVHNDQVSGNDSFSLSVKDRDGGFIDPFTFNVTVE